MNFLSALCMLTGAPLACAAAASTLLTGRFAPPVALAGALGCSLVYISVLL